MSLQDDINAAKSFTDKQSGWIASHAKQIFLGLVGLVVVACAALLFKV